ncbi:PucR family transcriptional regulator [Mycolicibacterium fortuitum]|uniref:PucR family transcriptional regulator n=1 Tax=Mycolicibacterium fortuitum TaxID=1766 RepID=UPI00138F3FA7|nr:PucR family transcriptional regulator [Mycolicibacterium fortuitum]
MDAAAFSAPDMKEVADDPELRAFTVRSTHAILMHWAAANAHKPGMPVPPNTDEPFEAVRLFTYRGYNQASLDAYRLGQNAAWRRWMKVAFGLTSDTDELREMLDVSAQSISDFVNSTIAATTAQIQKELDLLTRGRDSARRDMVTLILNGGPIGRDSVEQTLGYRLAQAHTAAVVWTTEAAPRLTELEHVADSLARHTKARDGLRIVASPGTIWLWLAGADTARLGDAYSAIGAGAGIQVAIGSTGRGIDGFRVSHLDAVSTQQTMARLNTDHPVGTFADVEGVLLLTSDPDRANRFIANTLGPLENAAPVVRDAVRTYLQEHGNASRAADRLFTHRNTILRRIKRADELLPRSLHENSLNIAMALEILYWRGGTARAHSEE